MQFTSILGNYPLVAAISAIFLAQVLKIPLHLLFDRKWDIRRVVSPGGMPSSHSAGVSALAASIAAQDGLDSSTFALAFVVGIVVMYDAMGIRRHAGEQAIAINDLEQAFDRHIQTDDPEFSRHDLRRKKERLKELLGHQPIEVAGGAAFGTAVGLLFYFFYR